MARRAKRVLIIEDDPSIAEVIEIALEDRGFKTRLAHEGGEALRLVREFRPTAITLDLALPGLDGRSFLLGLRASDPGRRTPVIVVSAQSDRLNDLEPRSIAKVLGKPFDIRELISAVERVAAA
jgi:DNA-binding response OmpR family regulator